MGEGVMTDAPTGGPAFPCDEVAIVNAKGRSLMSSAGMTLRDYFAIHAPEPDREAVRAAQAYDSARNPHNDSYKPRLRDEFEIRSQLRYQYADAMLKERAK